MKTLSAAILGVCVVVFAGAAAAQDDNAKKILGAWEVAKMTGDLPVGAVVDFQKDGKMAVILKEDGKEMKLAGTYKLEKDKLNVTLMIGEEKHEEALTIKKLTDDALELEDKDKKVETFVRPKKK
ncbi:MAG TPA: TIGR03066 family protein [Gemmata sp.]|nr:TIGR03066 family protein [Gemmata sp.]